MEKASIIQTLLHRILDAPRHQKRLISIVVDSALLGLAYIGAKSLRMGTLSFPESANEWAALLATILFSVYLFARTGLYRAILRHLAPQAMTTVVIGVFGSTLALIALNFFLRSEVPRTLPIIYGLIALVFVGGSRYLVRNFIISMTKDHKLKVIIYGAGSAGSQLALALVHGHEYSPIAFIDDDKELWGSVIQNIPVYSPANLQSIINSFSVNKLLLALPSVSNQRRKEILLSLEKYPIRVQTIAGMADLVSGVTVDQVRDIDVQDLLGRDPVAPKPELLSECITDKSVLVTGAGGSIGSELCRQILHNSPKTIVLVDHSEFALYSITNELEVLRKQYKRECRIVPIMTSVQNRRSMLTIMKQFSIQTVYHAAAYKHVPLVEYNVVEGVQNNIFGTWHTASAAMEASVERFVLVSTDKAVRPTNLMGATKRVAELCLQALSQDSQKTKFMMVRFGNVLGSSGSVVPLFKKQIKAGGPVTVTHPDVIRYFMTIPEAAQLVIQAGAMGAGGEVFVLDMGEPVKIVDMAQHMIRLMGLTPKTQDNEGDIQIAYTGLRPGEKLYEELLIGDDVRGTDHPRIMKANELHISLEELLKVLDDLRISCSIYDAKKLHSIMLSLPVQFDPSSEFCDLLSSTLNTSPEFHESYSLRLS